MTMPRSESCTIVLHDDRASREQVLCGSQLLQAGQLAHLSAPGARTLCIRPTALASNKHEVSLHMSLAAIFGFKHRTKGAIQLIEDSNEATATHVELMFRDQNLSRSDMWRMMRTIDDVVLCEGLEVTFLGSHTAKVHRLYVSGKQVDSALATCARTRPIFRSASARYTILIQVSRAMLEYWKDGDMMYERLLTGYLPELFQRWEAEKARHQITVVLFGRLYENGTAEDFFRVIASNAPSTLWPEVLRRLNTVFNDTMLPRQVSIAAQGNMVEAIHLAAKDYETEDTDPLLNRTGNSIIAITANAGLFDTEHDLLRRTTYLLLGNSIGVDIVALSPKPFHPVPLFRYQRNGVVEYALPHWVDVSYWNGSEATHWSPHWLLPGSQSTLDRVNLRPLSEECMSAFPISAAALMKAHDDDLFGHLGGVQSGQKTSKPIEVLHSDKFGSAETIKGPQEPVDRTAIRAKSPEPDEIAIRPKRDLPLGRGSMKKAKIEGGAPPHPLMQTSRKISVGPKGFAPGWSAASTTLSTEHAGHGKEPNGSVNSFTPNESSSGLARQIRMSLARKTSTNSVHSHSTGEPNPTSRPIDIQSNSEVSSEEADPVDVIEKNVLRPVNEDGSPTTTSPTATPRAGEYTLFGPDEIAPDDESHWTVSPWVTLLNPCNPKRDNMRVASQYRKWQHVFPRAVSSTSFKWSSMTTPASLPLTTEYRPSKRILEKYAAKKLRRILVSSQAGDGHEKTHRLIQKLISIRLAYGFQLPASKMMTAFPFHLDDGEPFLMSLGGVHHEIQCLSGSEIQIVEYSPMYASDNPGEDENTTPIKYRAKIRSVNSPTPIMATTLLEFSRADLDWTTLDDQVVSHHGSFVEEGVVKVRFVLIPVEFNKSGDLGPHQPRGLSDEERRIDGIQRLTQLWQRHRFFTPEDRQHHASMIRNQGVNPGSDRDPNPLAIEYQTKDPSAVVNAYGPTLTGQLSAIEGIPPLFAESDMYHSSTFDVAKLVRHMQEDAPHGVEMRDRRWFTRLHLKCFRGDEMVNWLVRVFKDLDSREGATAIGNELMRRGIFSHVRHKHDFRDGNYFYQITSSHRTTEYPDTASMFAKGLRSIPATPMPDIRNSPLLRPTATDSHSSGRETPLNGPVDRRQLLLSEKMQLSVDPNEQSEQLEVVNLHYDRIHNPENCYHIQLDWTNTTIRLVRDAVTRWSALIEPYGLRLVQVPLLEARRLPAQHPFQQLLSISLCVRPPSTGPSTPQTDPMSSFSTRLSNDPLLYQKAVLRKLGFVLDLEAASSFMTKLDVSYSWGRPEYELTQFIHNSGLVLAQIAADEHGDFVLLPNQLSQQPKAFGGVIGGGHRPPDADTVDSIVDAVTAFCQDAKGLAAFYEDMHNRSRALLASPFTPALGTSMGALRADADVPSFELPPQVNHRTVFRGI